MNRWAWIAQILALLDAMVSGSFLVRAETVVDEVYQLNSTRKILEPRRSCARSETSPPQAEMDLTQNACSLLNPESDPTVNSPMHRISSIAKKVSNVSGPLGGYLKRLIQDYSEVLNLEAYSLGQVGSENTGLSKYLLHQFQSDSELLKTAHRFYAEVERIDSENPKNIRPTIGTSVVPEHSGWLWKLALKHAENNPLKAMRLIGLCGHDDVNRGEKALKGPPLSDEEKKALFKNKLLELQSSIDFVIQHKEDVQKNGGSKEVLEDLEKHLNFQKSELHTLTTFGPAMLSGNQPFKCPSNYSNFFTPGSLGVDISVSTKRRVMKDQRKDVAAKYYHVIGAAIVACELVARGHPPELIAGLQKLLGWTYRTQRFNTEVCVVARRNFDAKPEGLSESSRVGRDAAELMQRWAFNTDGSLMGTKLKTPFQTNFRVAIPEWLEKTPLIGTVIDHVSRPAGWSDERYRKARAKFESYMTDWQWTTEAHEVGGEFGARVCRK